MKVIYREGLTFIDWPAQPRGGCRATAPALVVIVACIALWPAPGRAQTTQGPAPPDPLVQARNLYNEGRYEAAIEAATKAQQVPQQQNAASLILGRAGLERYRTTADPADLIRAREALRAVDSASLSSRDRADLVIGLGEALFFEELYGPAADLFESMLDRTEEIGPEARDRVLDWWATAVDRRVRAQPAGTRAAAYDRLIERMEAELRRDGTSAAAAYWLAAATFSRGLVERAWEAAIAGYVRALITPDRGATLRPDLDRLVREAIIPERLRRLPEAGTNQGDQASAAMTAEWELIKERWAGK
jgi:tetratricopeptide (TPR) repeat protein